MSSARFSARCKELFNPFPWGIDMVDPDGATFVVGQDKPHWYPKRLQIYLKTTQAARALLDLNAFALVEAYLSGEVDLEGNFYVLTDIKDYLPVRLNLRQYIAAALRNRGFQNATRAAKNVKSHYDMPQELLDDLMQPGQCQSDRYDSLEKAQWRKFKDAMDFLAPQESDVVMDVGCGYAGQLEVGLQQYSPKKFVGWTHSSNQVNAGKQRLSPFDAKRWEVNEGDYRQDERVYDHICSTGMISHVGPRGLLPYVRNIRQRIKQGGRYVHHALMANYSRIPLDRQVGIAFNKQYVWPGFHWFTLGEHVRALESNGFKVIGMTNLRAQYSKTITAWYERMMAQRAFMEDRMGEATFRAWRLYLGGGAGVRAGDVNRIYCVAV